MKRLYKAIIEEHFKHDQQMLFFIGPRQAGKTTVSLMARIKKMTNLHILAGTIWTIGPLS